jgi:hypothetical protein
MKANKAAAKANKTAPAGKTYQHGGRNPVSVIESPDGSTFTLSSDNSVHESLTAAAQHFILKTTGKVRSVNGRAFFGLTADKTPASVANKLDVMAKQYAGTPAEKHLKAAAEAVAHLPLPGPAKAPTTIVTVDGVEYRVPVKSLKPVGA